MVLSGDWLEENEAGVIKKANDIFLIPYTTDASWIISPRITISHDISKILITFCAGFNIKYDVPHLKYNHF